MPDLTRYDEVMVNAGQAIETLRPRSFDVIFAGEPRVHRAAAARALREEVYRKQLGALYIEYAYESWSDDERTRLGRVVADELFRFRGLRGDGPRKAVGPTVAEHRLGFLRRSELASVTLDAALAKVVKPLAEIDIVLSDAEHERIFGADVARV